MKVLNRIKDIRKEKKLTLRELERLSGVDYSAIQKIERGHHIPSQISIIKLSHALKMDVTEVFDFTYHSEF
jgi:transcriptional regulator with XRE-family HTH domain